METERRLIGAAQTGDVHLLHNLLKLDPQLLNVFSLTTSDTLLHIACLGAHLNFVQEMIKLKPCFANENHHGFSPLHIASANGNAEIVKELLNFDKNLCLVKGRGGEIPLHLAAARGREGVMKEILEAKVESVLIKTVRGESCLHLAVKNHQFEGFKVLVDHIKKFNMETILNEMDGKGDTFMHLAASRKQYEVVDLMTNENFFRKGTIEFNSKNKRGLTPLDVLVLEGGDAEIEEMLVKAGGVRASGLSYSQQTTSISQNGVTATHNTPNGEQRRPRSPSKQLQDYFKYDKVRDSPAKARNTLLVIAILIATGTYQAILSPPGGVWQDDFRPDSGGGSNRTQANGSKLKHHIAGRAVMGTNSPVSFGLFVLFNSVGFFASLHMIFFLTIGFPLQLELQVSIVALISTYDTCMTAITPNQSISIGFTVLSIVMPLTLPFVFNLVRNFVLKRKCPISASDQADSA